MRLFQFRCLSTANTSHTRRVRSKLPDTTWGWAPWVTETAHTSLKCPSPVAMSSPVWVFHTYMVDGVCCMVYGVWCVTTIIP
ncbi:hypothetical protein EON65_21755 [archaeon]|nr:MAG: hypothetical protein EON65_21755 [archaeon]